MKINMSAIVGLIAGGFVLLGGMIFSGVGLGPYISLSSFLITIGGTIVATMIGAPTGFWREFRNIMRISISTPNQDYRRTIDNFVRLSDKARRDGLLALEDEIVDIPDEFTRKGLQMVVDGTDPDIIKNTLYTQVDEMQSRHIQVQNAFELIGRVAPAWGLIGTIIGLIALLGNIGGDATAIGRGLQIALVTTYYGAVFANFWAIPTENRLKAMDAEEYRYHAIIMEGVLAIQSGENPRIVRDRLMSFLSGEARAAIVQEE